MTRKRSRRTAALAALLILLLGDATVVVAADTDEADASPTGPGAALEALLAHIPESHREACRPDLVNEEPKDGSVMMSVLCELPDGLTVYYTQLESAEALSRTYQRKLESHSVIEGSGDCPDLVPGEGSYAIGGEPAGRLMCDEEYDIGSLRWTHDSTNIYGQAYRAGDAESLWAWWTAESGPLESAADLPETGLGVALDALLLQVPESHRATCVPFYGGDPGDGYVVSLRCDPSSDLDVYYHQFDSIEALAAAYQSDLDDAEIRESSGDCSQVLPGEEPYNIGGEPVGRLLCMESIFGEGIRLTWTHQPTLIKATAISERDLAGLWEWWLSASGPIG